jgi:hypothetical protein
MTEGRSELAAIRLIGRSALPCGVQHTPQESLRGNRDEHFDQREYNRATRVHWTIPMYPFNSSSTRNKLLTACVQSPMREEEKWQRENHRTSQCPKEEFKPNPESEETFGERTASAERETLLDKLALRSGGNHQVAQGTKDQPRRLVFHSGEARRSRPAKSTRPVHRPRPDPHRRQSANGHFETSGILNWL